MYRVLFVCLGNICRSPAAEGVLKHLLEEHDLCGSVVVDSAGTSCYHIGEPADKRMRQAASRRGVDLDGRSRMVSSRDFAEFDLLVAMDNDNFRELQKIAGSSGGKVKMLSDYLDDTWPSEVPDPYYGGESGFEQVLDMLFAACPKLMADIPRRN